MPVCAEYIQLLYRKCTTHKLLIQLLNNTMHACLFVPSTYSHYFNSGLVYLSSPTPSEAHLPPFLKMLSREISCDGPGQSKATIWSLRIGSDGKLFVFNNGKPVNSPSAEVMAGQLHHSKDMGAVSEYVRSNLKLHAGNDINCKPCSVSEQHCSQLMFAEFRLE